MNKKQLTALVNQAVQSVVATANQDTDSSEPLMTEEEARTMFGMRLKKSIKKIVAEACFCDVSDVIWVDAEAKAAAEDDSDDAVVA